MDGGNVGVLAYLVLGLLGGNRGHVVDDLVCQGFQCVAGDDILQPVLGDGSLVAGMAALAIGAGVIVVLPAAFAGAGLSCHGRAALSAEDLPGEEVGDFRFPSCRRCRVVFQAALHEIPHVVRHDARDGIFLPDIRVLVYPDVLLIPENILEAGFVELRPFGCAVAAGVEITANGGGSFPRSVAGEGFLHQRRGERINYPFLLFDFVPQRDGTAQSLPLQGALAVSPLYFLL